MRIFLVGCTGFIGTSLANRLASNGHELELLAREPSRVGLDTERVAVVPGDPLQPGMWQDRLKEAEAVVNLTGAPIFSRWTATRKKLIYESRIHSTANVVAAIGKPGASVHTLVNASAAGYYGFCGDEPKTEEGRAGDDFLARLCVDWEKEALKACHLGVRVVTPRIGVVLAAHGGALAKMLPAFRLGIGGRLGNGRQWFPWIHLADLVEILCFLLASKEIHGPVNSCAPNPVRNREFTAALARALHRPAILPIPGWLLTLVFGEMGGVLLEGNRMVPSLLTRQGFSFRFPDIDSALADLVKKA